MLLQIMALALDICHGLFARGELNTSDLAFGGVGLLRLHGKDEGDYPFPLRPILEERRIRLVPLLWLWFATDGLVECPCNRRRGVKQTGLEV
jgi:hypothetical protein